jgi:acyl carrier protein
MTQPAAPAAVAQAVRRAVVRESRLSIDPDRVPDTEPLLGDLLRVSSLGLLGMLVRLEEELDMSLPDDLFAGRRFHTVADVIDAVAAGYRQARP